MVLCKECQEEQLTVSWLSGHLSPDENGQLPSSLFSHWCHGILTGIEPNANGNGKKKDDKSVNVDNKNTKAGIQ